MLHVGCIWLYTSHGPCMVCAWTICFLHLFGMCSTPTSLGHAHRPSYKFPPGPPWALSTRMAGVMQRTSNAVWMGDNAMVSGHLVAVCEVAAHRIPCTPPVVSHAPCPLCPMHPARCVPHALPIASYTPCLSRPTALAIMSHTDTSLCPTQTRSCVPH